MSCSCLSLITLRCRTALRWRRLGLQKNLKQFLENDQLRLTTLIAAFQQTLCWGCCTWILKSEAVFASCLFVVEQLGCWRRLGSSNLKRSLLHVSSLSNSLAAGGDLEIFKSEAAFASCLFAVEQLGCWRRLGSSNLKQLLLHVSSLPNSLAAGGDLDLQI